MGLNTLRTTPWHIQPACARTGEGIPLAFHHLGQLVRQHRKNNRH